MSAPPIEPGIGVAPLDPSGGRAAGGRRPACPDADPVEADAFVGSILDDDGSVTILLRGRFDTDAIRCVGEHVDIAIGRGVRFLVVDVIGPLTADRRLSELLGRTQSRLAARRGMLVIRGLVDHIVV